MGKDEIIGALVIAVIICGTSILINDILERKKNNTIACMQKYQTPSYKVADDSIYCIREEYILLKKADE